MYPQMARKVQPPFTRREVTGFESPASIQPPETASYLAPRIFGLHVVYLLLLLIIYAKAETAYRDINLNDDRVPFGCEGRGESDSEVAIFGTSISTGR